MNKTTKFNSNYKMVINMEQQKIIIQIFGSSVNETGTEAVKITKGCSGGCGSCSSGCSTGGGGCCSSKPSKPISELIEDLKNSVKNSDISSFTQIEYIDLDKLSSYDYENIDYLIEQGFNPPLVAIDGVVRFYGGISFKAIYEDIVELLK